MKTIYNHLIIASVLFLSTPAYAHEDWVEPATFVFEQTEKTRLPYTLSFNITASDRYFHDDRNRLIEDFGGFRFSITGPDGSKHVPTFLTLGKTKTYGEVTLNQQGTYLLDLKRTNAPLYYSKLKLPSGNGVEYVTLSKADLTEEQLARRESTGAYYHHAKAFVTVESPTDIWQQPVGHLQEIVPLADPNHITTMTPFPIQVLFKGKPYKQANIRLIYQGYQPVSYGSAPFTATTDDNGKADLTFDRAGRWIIETAHEEENAEQSTADTTKYAAVLMIEVH